MNDWQMWTDELRKDRNLDILFLEGQFKADEESGRSNPRKFWNYATYKELIRQERKDNDYAEIPDPPNIRNRSPYDQDEEGR